MIFEVAEGGDFGGSPGGWSPGFPGIISGNYPARQISGVVYDVAMFFFKKKKVAPTEFVPVVLPDPASQSEDNSAPRKKILVVDDDAVVAKTLALALNKRGYQVLCATD